MASGSPVPPADASGPLRTVLASANPAITAWAGEHLPTVGAGVCISVATARDAVRESAAGPVDLCVIDLHLADAVVSIGALADRCPSTRILALGREPDDPLFLRALDAGASGCVSAASGLAGLRRSVRDVLAGQVAVPRALVADLVAHLRPAGPGRAFER